MLIEDSPDQTDQSTPDALTTASTIGTFSDFTQHRQWGKDRAKASYQVIICTSEIDWERVESFVALKEKWGSLKQKYECDSVE